METLDKKIYAFKKKYFLNLIIQGSIWLSTSIIVGYVLISIGEYVGNFSVAVRTTIILGYGIYTISFLFYWVLRPAYYLFQKKNKEEEKLCRMIGSVVPMVADKLLNIIQLRKQKNTDNAVFIEAAIEQKTKEFKKLQFTKAIQLKKNLKYFKYVLSFIALFFFIFYIKPEVFLETTPRLVQFQTHFEPKAPFHFQLINNLEVFRNQDYTISVKIEGESIPKEAWVHISGMEKKKLLKTSHTTFEYRLSHVDEDFSFYFQALGFDSKTYSVKLRDIPIVVHFKNFLSYPKYTKRINEVRDNTGNLIVPQGTVIRWDITTKTTDEVGFQFQKEKKYAKAKKIAENKFSFSKNILVSQGYTMEMANEYKKITDQIEFFLTVIPDETAKIEVNSRTDTVFYEYIDLYGSISDDYGIQTANFCYSITKNDTTSSVKKVPIENIKKNISIQNFLHRISLKKLSVLPNTTLHYYIEVWDNDEVNGNKKSTSPIFHFQFPEKEKIIEKLEKDKKEVEVSLKKTEKKTEDFSKYLENMYQMLKTKTKIGWTEKKKIKEALEKSQNLRKEIEDFKKKYNDTFEREEKINKELGNEYLQQQMQELKKIIEDILDKKNQELFENIEKMMEKEKYPTEISNLFKKLLEKHKKLKEELERSVALFKKLKLESQVSQTLNKLKKLRNEEEKWEEKIQNTPKKEASKLLKEDEVKMEKWKKIKEDIADIDTLAKEIHAEKYLEKMASSTKEVDEHYQKLQKSLQENNLKEAGEQQKKKEKKQKEIENNLKNTLDALQKNMLFENYDDLRKIFENILKLSFDQEELFIEFGNTESSDPKFVELSLSQSKLNRDAQIIKDSLLSLAKRATQVQSFITEKVQEMDYNMNESALSIKKRDLERLGIKLRYNLTSINDLALLLSNLLNNMRLQLGMMMPGQQNSQKNTPQNQELSQQQQKLNQQIEQLMRGGGKGREISEELAKIVEEQEKIRKALEEEKRKGRKELGEMGKQENLSNIIEKMKQTELELVNKEMTEKMMRRQKEILTRLLKSEKAKKEKDYQKEREAKTGDQNLHDPKEDILKEYLKKKKQQIELLQPIYLKIQPYYKKKIEEYLNSQTDPHI